MHLRWSRQTALCDLTVANTSELHLFVASQRPNAFATTIRESAATPHIGLDFKYALREPDFAGEMHFD